jgi:hypothetical protein
MPAKKFVLLRGECDPELIGVFDEQEDARNAAEIREGGPLAWLDGWQSNDYRVVAVPYMTHAQAVREWWARTRKELEV